MGGSCLSFNVKSTWSVTVILIGLSLLSLYTQTVTGMEMEIFSPNCTTCKNTSTSGCSECHDGCYLDSPSTPTTAATLTTQQMSVVSTPSVNRASLAPQTNENTTVATKREAKCRPCLDFCRVCTLESKGRNCTYCFDGYQLDVNNTCSKVGVEEDGLSVGAIVAVVIAGVVFLALIVLLVIFLIRRSKRRKAREPASFEEVGGTPGSPQTPKIETEEMQRVHDQITRYTKDPTRKIDTPVLDDPGSTQGESTELDQLPVAPPPPLVQGSQYMSMGQSYDQLQTNNTDAPESYQDLQFNQESVYGNVQAIQAARKSDQPNTNGRQSPKEIYYNDQANGAGSFHGNQQHSHQIQPQISEELYEPVVNNLIQGEQQGLQMNQEDQEIYMNETSENPHQEPQEIYSNEAVFDQDDIYENTKGH